MNWKVIKIVYQIEKERCNSSLLSLIFAVITALFLCLIFFRPTLIVMTGKYVSMFVMKQFLMYMTIFFGITFSLLFIQELRSDYGKGVFHTFLTYPINPGELVLSKLMALGLYVLYIIIGVTLLFLILSGIFLVWGAVWSISLLIGVLILIFVTYSLSLIISPLMNLSPLPEILIILFFLTVTFFSFSIPSQYLALLAPFLTIPEIIMGVKQSSQIIIFSIGGIFFYFVLGMISYIYMNMRKGRYVP